MVLTSRALVWPAVREERRALVRDLRELTASQWRAPSLCPGWDVHDVLAHLVDTARTTRLGFVRRMVLARFDFDRDNATGIARQRRADPSETLARLGAVVDRTTTPPAPLATRLVEAVVHGEDIRRPLGIARTYPIEPVVTALRYQLRTTVGMGGGRERAQGWLLHACDADLAHGAGPEVRGTAVDLLLAVSGRPVAAEAFDSAGAAAFAAHLAS